MSFMMACHVCSGVSSCWTESIKIY